MPCSQSLVVQCVLMLGCILFSIHLCYLVTDDDTQSAVPRPILKNTFCSNRTGSSVTQHNVQSPEVHLGKLKLKI
jgi:hypothetical protein